MKTRCFWIRAEREVLGCFCLLLLHRLDWWHPLDCSCCQGYCLIVCQHHRYCRVEQGAPKKRKGITLKRAEKTLKCTLKRPQTCIEMTLRRSRPRSLKRNIASNGTGSRICGTVVRVFLQHAFLSERSLLISAFCRCGIL